VAIKINLITHSGLVQKTFFGEKTGSDSECVLDVEVKKKKNNSDWVLAQLWNLEFEKPNSKKG